MPNGFLSTQGELPNSLYYARFHPHLHAIVADGLFRRNGTFYVLPKCEMKQLEKIFRSRILAMLKCVVLRSAVSVQIAKSDFLSAYQLFPPSQPFHHAFGIKYYNHPDKDAYG